MKQERYDFEPIDAAERNATEHDSPKPVRRPRRGKGGIRRKLAAVAVLGVALIGTGGAFTFFAGNSGAADTTSSASDIEAGRQLYNTTCITCHGANLQGVTDRGPSLLGVGAAATYFQVSTGRMPLTAQGSTALRHPSQLTDEQTRQLAAYVQSLGGGPEIPTGELRDMSSIGEGGVLFRLNCASCHGSTGKGAPLSAGAQAPSLNSATDLQLFTAMLSGPENMPVFSDNQITPAQKASIVAYIQTLKASADPGGHGIGRLGPASEAIVIWVGGIGILMIAILWIGAKTQ